MTKKNVSVGLIIVYMELVFHIYMKLDMAYAPIFLLGAASIGAFCTGILFFLPGKVSEVTGELMVTFFGILFTAECLFKDIFQQYYQIASGLETAAGNHLTDYWQAVLEACIKRIPGIVLLMIVPLGVYFFLFNIEKRRGGARGAERTSVFRIRRGLKQETKLGLAAVGIGVLLHLCMLAVVFLVPWGGDFNPPRLYRTDTYTDDQVEQLGLLTMLRLDVKHCIFGAPEHLLPEIKNPVSDGDAASGEEEEPTDDGAQEPVVEEIKYNEMDIDFQAVKKKYPSDGVAWLSDYFASTAPTKQNEYTGMFEGYNVIFITAEGFSGYMIDEKLTPTLYKLSHEGFVFSNFYSALHFTSTSGGEFQNLTGLYPKAGFPVSMTETGKQGTSLPFNLAKVLNKKGYTSKGYHFNQNMYGRKLSHPNLGYEWRQTTDCDRPVEKEVAEKGYKFWPQSDDYMVSQTFGDYAGHEPFNVYYLTISGHLPYGFGSNQMSVRNQSAVSDLPYSEKTKAYIAAGLELEKGLTRLVNQLQRSGLAERTLIVMAPDHVPYSDLDILEELSGKTFGTDSLESLNEKNVDFDVYKNTWILWSASMEEPVQVDKVCSQVDILPTVLNLLGAEYDSRMLSGTDILSDTDGQVVFFCGSWKTDKGFYDRYSGTFTPAEGVVMSEEEQAAYVENMQYLAKCRLKLGQLIIENDYYAKALE